jgi:hypothetical protein|nr:MAG TPA: Helix-turn-helix XRE-family like protein [Caudoviricetes sp.]DAR67617.1 MAG TPA: Helix-turn-helix XRE-family like protein [Caudoviricetes sp.]DAT02688.1 MAG TPA: Helix-turn-helix XRE-family like protein [Caudoviricetes sp.]
MKISLKAARITAGMTQDEVAELLGVHVQTYRKLEENPNLATIEQAKKLSDRLNVPYDDIFFAE